MQSFNLPGHLMVKRENGKREKEGGKGEGESGENHVSGKGQSQTSSDEKLDPYYNARLISST